MKNKEKKRTNLQMKVENRLRLEDGKNTQPLGVPTDNCNEVSLL